MLDKIFNPKSIAVIGASNVPGKWGFAIPLNILTNCYNGKLYLINPHEKKILGLKAYKKLEEIPDNRVDLAIITIPAQTTPQALIECGKCNIPYVIVISSNFAEASEEGAKLEKEIVSIAKSYNIRIIGPNTMGIYSASSSLFAFGSPIRPQPGKVGLISQSGNIGVQMLGLGKGQNIGFSKFVGSGNEADLTTVDYLEYFGEDKETEIIAIYIESIKNGKRFYEVAKRVGKQKPIIVLKSAKTKIGAKAALSHTGAIAAKKELTEAIFNQCGIIEVNTTEEIIDLIKALLKLPPPKGNNVGVITLGGGWGVVAAESCENQGLNLPQFEREDIEKLNNILPPFWSKSNPADLVGTIRRKAHFEALEIITASKNIHAVIAMGMLAGRILSTKELIKGIMKSTINFYKTNFIAALTFLPTFIKGVRKAKREIKTNQWKITGGSGGFNPAERKLWQDRSLCELINTLIKKYHKPIIAVTSDYQRAVKLAYEFNTVAYHTPEKAAFVLAKLANYGQFLNKKEVVLDYKINMENIKKIFNNKKILNEYESKKILSEYQIPVVKEIPVKSFNEAKRKAKEINYPVVLKILSDDILHKTDNKLIALNVRDEQELKVAYNKILNNAKKLTDNINGMLIQEMIKDKIVEVIIGINYDENFGHLIMFGLGGIFTEVLEDVTFRIPPIDKEEAYRMIKETKGYKILQGARGSKKADIDLLCEILVKVSQLSINLSDYIKELDINPLIVSEDKIKVVDALIITKYSNSL